MFSDLFMLIIDIGCKRGMHGNQRTDRFCHIREHHLARLRVGLDQLERFRGLDVAVGRVQHVQPDPLERRTVLEQANLLTQLIHQLGQLQVATPGIRSHFIRTVQRAIRNRR